MIKSQKISMSRKSRPVADPGGDPAEAVAQTHQSQVDEGYQSLDNKYETAGFAISAIFKNWQKSIIIILTVLFTIGLVLLLLLPGYKCQTETRLFEKTPVELPGKKLNPSDSN